MHELDPGSPYYPEAIWRAGFMHDERWLEGGDPADRDMAIRRLTEALGLGPRSGAPEPEIHATLAAMINSVEQTAMSSGPEMIADPVGTALGAYGSDQGPATGQAA